VFVFSVLYNNNNNNVMCIFVVVRYARFTICIMKVDDVATEFNHFINTQHIICSANLQYSSLS